MNRKNLLAYALSLCLLLSLFPHVSAAAQYPGSHAITLRSVEQSNGAYEHQATLDGAPMEIFDYTWRVDPGSVHNEVKDAPAEYFTGEKPETDAAAPEQAPEQESVSSSRARVSSRSFW